MGERRCRRLCLISKSSSAASLRTSFLVGTPEQKRRGRRRGIVEPCLFAGAPAHAKEFTSRPVLRSDSGLTARQVVGENQAFVAGAPLAAAAARGAERPEQAKRPRAPAWLELCEPSPLRGHRRVASMMVGRLCAGIPTFGERVARFSGSS